MPAAATNEYAVMIDARDALEIGPAAKSAELQPMLNRGELLKEWKPQGRSSLRGEPVKTWIERSVGSGPSDRKASIGGKVLRDVTSFEEWLLNE
jgi:hypothetical protein